MKLIIELSAEDVNNTTIGIIQQLFAQNTKTETGSTTVKSTTETKPKTIGSSTSTPNIELYDLDEILPETPKQTPSTNAERLQAFAKKIESTLNDRDKKALEKFVNFYLPKINSWKPDISIQNLWDRWINSERK